MKRGPSCAGRALICAAVLAACGRAPAGPAVPVKVSGPLPPGEPQVRATAVVISRKGKVELQRGLLGNWADAQVGDRLAPSDALRTHEGEAEVGVDGVKMRMHEASALRLKDANPSWMRAQVRGSVESEVEPGKGSLDVLAVLRALREVKFQGYISIEYEANPENPIPDIRACLDVLRESVRKLA